MANGDVELVVDPIDEMIEELSALTAAWQKRRDKNSPSPILRKSIIQTCGELLDCISFHEGRKVISKPGE